MVYVDTTFAKMIPALAGLEYPIENRIFEIREPLNCSGEYGWIYSVTARDSTEQYILKVWKQDDGGLSFDPGQCEKQALFDLVGCPCCLNAAYWFEYDGWSGFFTQRYSEGDLQSVINSLSIGVPLHMHYIHGIMKALLIALSEMHSKGYAHRDVKLGNVLMHVNTDNQWFISLADFGFAAKRKRKEKFCEFIGTTLYKAPELLLEQPYTEKVDMWAAGVCLYQLLTGGLHPFGFSSYTKPEDLRATACEKQYNFKKLTKSIPPSVNDEGKRAIVSLMNGLLDCNPKTRIDAASALEHWCWAEQHLLETAQD
jgi:serine/threonine protein kinase